MLDRALCMLRIDRCLDLWAGQVDVHEIADTLTEEFGYKATEYTVRGIVSRAREEDDDPRAAAGIRSGAAMRVLDIDAAMEAEIARLKEKAEREFVEPEKLKNAILDLWADGMEAEEIADHLGTYRTKVRDTVDRARYEGDERAHQRKVRAAPVEHVSTNTLGIETETREIAVKDAVQSWDCRRPVTLKRVTTQVDVFRPMKMSIEARASGTIDRTADLMGDPPPERSALGRPVRPDEYASRGGEGRYRDHKTPLRLTSAVGIAARRGVTPAAAVARQERYQRGEPMYGQKRAVPKHFNEYAPFHGGKEG